MENFKPIIAKNEKIPLLALSSWEQKSLEKAREKSKKY